MRRIGLAVILAVSVILVPLAAETQPAGKVWRIGELLGSEPGESGAALLQGLRQLGYIEGQNIVFERRYARGRPDRLPGLAAELVHLNVDVIVTSGPDAIRAAQQASRTIPIVAAIMHEPVVFGFVEGFARPGGNITGLAFQDSDLTTKRLQLLKETLPGLSHVAALYDPNAGGPTALSRAQEAARALGFTLQALEAKSPADLPRAVDSARRGHAQALLQLASPFRRGKRRPAVGARPRQGCRALLAELRAGVIIVLAPRTLHPGPSLGDARTQTVDFRTP